MGLQHNMGLPQPTHTTLQFSSVFMNAIIATSEMNVRMTMKLQLKLSYGTTFGNGKVVVTRAGR